MEGPKEVYKVEVSRYNDTVMNAVISIEPPVNFFNDEARQDFCKNVIQMMDSIVGFDDIQGGRLNLTHNSLNNEATIGYASLKILKDDTGREILRSVISTALNGS